MLVCSSLGHKVAVVFVILIKPCLREVENTTSKRGVKSSANSFTGMWLSPAVFDGSRAQLFQRPVSGIIRVF